MSLPIRTLACGLLFTTLATPALAGEKYPGIMPLSQVKVGMKGYGLTTFKGNTISRFEVTVLGIVKQANNGRDLILIRMKGGPITERQANLIQGMSGSPIYVNGKLIGGFSQGESFSKEPIGMATPIEDMLEAWDSKIPQTPTYFTPAEINPKLLKKTAWKPDNGTHIVQLPAPICVQGRTISRLVFNAPLTSTLRSSSGTAVLHRATTYLMASNLKQKERDWLQKELDSKGYGVTVMAGSGLGKSETTTAPPLQPGSPFGTFFATGDVNVGATGTVTYRLGDRILGYGHPFFGLGAVEAPLTSASIVDIFSGYQVSHHIATVGKTIGSLVQDRNFSVAGVIGRSPHTVPFTVHVNDHTNGRSRTFHSEVFLHPDLTPTLMRLVARQAISQVHDIPGDSMAKVTSSVTAEEMGTVERRNIVYDPADIATPATQDLSDILVIAGGNPFYPLPIRSGRVTVDIYSGHNTATIERIFLKQGRFESGDTLEVGVQLKPYRRPAFVQSLFFKVPANLPSGRYQLIVRGGAPTATRFGGFLLSGGGEPTTPPATIAQMIARLKEQNVNTDLVGKLILNSAAPSVEGEHLSQLPPHLSALMRSDRNSAVRLERDEIKTSLSLSVVVSGTQQMFVNIQKRVTQEAGGDSRILSPSNSGSDSPGSGSSGSIIRLGNPSSTGEDVSAPFDLSPREIPLYRLWLSAEQGLPARSAPQTPPPPAIATPAPTSVGGAVSTLPPATIAPAKPALPDRPVGKLAKIWRQTGRGFSAGRFQGASLSANGELRPTASLTRLTSTNETYLWSLVSDKQGNLYAGTGNTGSLLAISLQGAHRTLAKLPAVAVQSLLYGVDGNLYAGTGPRGEVFRVSTSGKVTSLGKIAEKYVTTLAQDSRGNLTIGAGGSGTVYRLNAGSSSIVPYIKTGSDFITALTFDSKDNLYVGAGLEGTLYKVTPEGKSSIVYTSKEGTVLAVAVDDKGYLYIGTGPRGNLLGIAPDGTVSTLYDKATSYYTSLKMTPEGTLFAVTANSVYHVRPNALPDGSPLITTLDSPKDLDFLTVLPLSGGRVAIGTGNIGEVYLADKNQARSGTFESVIHDTRIESRWGSARWTEQTPKGTGITVFTRSGNVAEPDSTWSDWAQVQRESADSGKVTSPSARFLQYRVKLELGTGEQTPSLKELSISYVSRNQAPKVNFQSPLGGERWSGSQSLRWSAVDPDGDSLLFDTYYSANNGATWIPLPSGKMETASAIVSPTQGEVSLEELKAKLDRTVMPQTMRDLLLERARQKQGGSTAFAPPQPTKETNRTFDTTLLPDGVYLFKVVASDALGDPAERKQGIGVSEAVTLCNTLPQLSGIKSTVLPTKAVRIEGLASQKLLAITAVQYRVDDGEWLPALSRDGLFDGYSESFTLTTFPLPPGAHTVEVLAFNSANGKRSTKISVTVP